MPSPVGATRQFYSIQPDSIVYSLTLAPATEAVRTAASNHPSFMIAGVIEGWTASGTQRMREPNLAAGKLVVKD